MNTFNTIHEVKAGKTRAVFSLAFGFVTVALMGVLALPTLVNATGDYHDHDHDHDHYYDKEEVVSTTTWISVHVLGLMKSFHNRLEYSIGCPKCPKSELLIIHGLDDDVVFL